jgi:hypothetical protein
MTLTKDICKIQGKDLNSIYFIEFVGRFWMEIGSNFEWIWDNWAFEYSLNNSMLFFEDLKLKSRQGWWRKPSWPLCCPCSPHLWAPLLSNQFRNHDSWHQPMGLMRLDYVRSMVFHSTTRCLPGLGWVPGSHLFIVDKFRDLSLQEPELPEVIGSSTGHLPVHTVRLGLINETQLRHGSSMLGEAGSDPLEDKAVPLPASPRNRSNLLVAARVCLRLRLRSLHGGTGWATHREAHWRDRPRSRGKTHMSSMVSPRGWQGKRHDDRQDDSTSSEGEAADGAPSWRHHTKFNQWCSTPRPVTVNPWGTWPDCV